MHVLCENYCVCIVSFMCKIINYVKYVNLKMKLLNLKPMPIKINVENYFTVCLKFYGIKDFL